MASAVTFVKWESYTGCPGIPAFFQQEPLTFKSRQERLRQLAEGDQLRLVSRAPMDQQYYFVAVLQVLGRRRNSPESPEGQLYGEYAVLADRSRSLDLGTRFPAEGLLRAFEFVSGRPIKQGASVGQSLQTLRFLSPEDAEVQGAALKKAAAGQAAWSDVPCGLWTKCDAAFADYFLNNWSERKQCLAFLLYDPPPALHPGAPVFIHSDKALRLIATFRGSQFVAGYKPTVDQTERLSERERVWREYREATLDPPSRPEFDEFWEGQHGVRGLFLMNDVTEAAVRVTFKEYGRALGWGYPMGVGYRYLTLAQSYLLLRAVQLPADLTRQYLTPLLERTG
jgi:hypothetical protein